MLSKRKESPYAVLLTANTNMTPIVCSRTLVTARWVLTAAACLTRIKIVSDILINAKDRSLHLSNRKHFKLSQTIRSSTYYSLQNYTVFDGNTVDNDIALVKAKEKFKLSISVNTIKLLYDPWSHHGFVSCSVTAFGKVKLYVNDTRVFKRRTYSFSMIKPCKCFEKEERVSAWLCPYPSDKTGVCARDFRRGLFCNGKIVGVTSVLISMANLKYCSVGSSNGLFSAECGTINMITTFHKIYLHLYVDWINEQATYIQSIKNKQKVKLQKNQAASTLIQLTQFIVQTL